MGTSILEELRNEYERILYSIQPPDYRSSVQAVYRHVMRPEMVKNYPAAWFTISQSLYQEGRSAAGRVDRLVTMRAMFITREDLNVAVETANDAIVQDYEIALTRELAALQTAVRQKTGADVVWVQPPTWEQIDTTFTKPYGLALSVTRVHLRYDYGQP